MRANRLWGAIAFAALACAPGGSEAPYRVLGSDLGVLRSAFNDGVGRVRFVMLAAPT